MLSHIHDQIDMVFFGALTLKDTMNFVMNPGALSIITEFHLEKIPIYMFMGTDKFSLWKSKKRGEIFIHKHKRTHIHKPIEYERIKYSHDRVPAKLFKKIVTNEGVLTPLKLKKVFNEAFKNPK
jgi:translation initiation factor 2B subunit (eIF-2B alpha/beta/delta family)